MTTPGIDVVGLEPGSIVGAVDERRAAASSMRSSLA